MCVDRTRLVIKSDHQASPKHFVKGVCEQHPHAQRDPNFGSLYVVKVGRDQSMVQRTSLDLIRKLGSQEKQTLSGVLDEVTPPAFPALFAFGVLWK